jgi:hypothetical protein
VTHPEYTEEDLDLCMACHQFRYVHAPGYKIGGKLRVDHEFVEAERRERRR